MADRSDKTVLLVLGIGHGVTDLYANFLSGLLPFFKNNLNLSKSLSGALIFAMTFSGSFCQVLYAYLGDKWGRKFFVVVGPAVCAIFLCFIALSPNFYVLLILLLLGTPLAWWLSRSQWRWKFFYWSDIGRRFRFSCTGGCR